MRGFSLIFSLLVTSFAAGSATPVAPPEPAPDWTVAPTSASAGYFSLAWNRPTRAKHATPENYDYELQQCATPACDTTTEIIYSGPDTGTTISGQSDGPLYYRVRILTASNESDGSFGNGAGVAVWSKIHTVHVKHHPIGRAFLFLFTGLFVFLATAGLILFGGRR